MTLHRLAMDAAQRRPDGNAVRCDDAGLSWAELARRSNAVAHALVDGGLARGERVAVLLRKSLEVPVAFHGVLAAGGALVPIDPKAPPAQMARILRATGATRLLTEPDRAGEVDKLLEACPDLGHVLGPSTVSRDGVQVTPAPDLAAFASDEPPGVEVGADDTSYIQHTSGSTGEPKLIRHTHASARAFVDWAVGEYGLTGDDRLSNHSSHHTCFATFDFYAAAGAAASTVILTPAAMLMPASLAALVEREGITTWYSVPTALVQLLLRGNLEARQLDALRWVLFAGETFPRKHLLALMERLPGARFSHVYGSTEVNVCTCFHLPPAGAVPDPLPIGQPCAGTQALVVDEALEPVAPGEPGELLISGPTVMAGYLGDEDRNRAALVERTLPDGARGRCFRTGDRVQQLDDGQLAFAGRTDLQVKVRGHRVELEEVENALLGLGPVQEAVAFAVPDGEGSALVRAAVVCVADFDGGPKALVDGLRGVLPPYAVPAAIDLREVLPRTPTGKVDRKALVSEWGAEQQQAEARQGESHD